MKELTKVLSARIPVDVMTAIDEMAKSSGMNRSQWVTNVVATAKINDFKMSAGNVIQIKPVPEDIEQLLVAGGVAVVGIGSYSLMTDYLEKQRKPDGTALYNSDEIKFIGAMVGIAISMVSFGIYKAISNGK